jgi:adenylosuccinate synthase
LIVLQNEHTNVASELQPLLDEDWVDWLIEAYNGFAQQARIVSGAYLRTILRRPGTVIFEGAQGILLDEWQGFHPFTTWSATTLENARRLLGEAGYAGQITRLGITRAYATRHGAGPLVTEDAELTRVLPDPANGFGVWQRGFRVGWLDLVMLRYALEVVGELDQLALTCLDRLAELRQAYVCRHYRYDSFSIDRILRSSAPLALAYQEQVTRRLASCLPILEPLPEPEALPILLEAELGVAIGLISEGPTADDKRLI